MLEPVNTGRLRPPTPTVSMVGMTNTEAKRLGANIRRIRRERRLTQEELAERAYISRSYVAHIETGRNVPALDVISHIADALRVRLGDLLGETEAEPLLSDGQVITRLEGVLRGVHGIPIPLRGIVPADAVRYTAAEREGKFVRVAEALIGSRSPDNLFAVQLSGGCLRQIDIPDGCIVILEHDPSRTPKNGNVVLVRMGDDYTLKAWYQCGGYVELRDGQGDVVHIIEPGDDFVIEGYYVSHYRPADS